MATQPESQAPKSPEEHRRRAYIKKMMKRPTSPIKGFKTFINKRRPAINSVLREVTAGGIIFRHAKKSGEIEFLLIQDAKNRWTIPKGHMEEGENSKETAKREIGEETGLKEIDVLSWLGKINFRYRRQQSLVLISQDIFLVRARGDTDSLVAEDWMNDIRWFKAAEALDKIEYEDIGKLMLVALNKIRKGNL